jgi:hypothetical protein
LARRALSRFENFRQAIQKPTIHVGSISVLSSLATPITEASDAGGAFRP